MLRATQTLNRRNPRMVKRRNSPYASHDRTAKTNVPIYCTPCMVPAADAAVKARQHKPKPAGLWSEKNPLGGFIL